MVSHSTSRKTAGLPEDKPHQRGPNIGRAAWRRIPCKILNLCWLLRIGFVWSVSSPCWFIAWNCPRDVLGKRTGWGAVCTARCAHPMPRSVVWRRPSANLLFDIISYSKIDSCARIGFVSYFPFASLLASPKRAHRFLVLFYTPVPSFPSMGDPKSLQVLEVSTRDGRLD